MDILERLARYRVPIGTFLLLAAWAMFLAPEAYREASVLPLLTVYCVSLVATLVIGAIRKIEKRSPTTAEKLLNAATLLTFAALLWYIFQDDGDNDKFLPSLLLTLLSTHLPYPLESHHKVETH